MASFSKAIIAILSLGTAVQALEYSRGNNGDPWNAWGNVQQGSHEAFGSGRGNGGDPIGGAGMPVPGANFRQCVKPWQRPVMTIATISMPAHAVTCHPDHRPCELDVAECQFSFSTFQYICCRDREDVKPPECPKYHSTLRTLCGGVNDVSCPRSYRCLPSRFDPNIEICCKPNSTIVYPEPDTSFRDNFIVPEHLPASPMTEIKIKFKSLTMAPGQLVATDDIDDLLKHAPTLLDFEGDDSKFYTIVLFGFPRNAPTFVKGANRATLHWLVHNANPSNGTFFADGYKRTSGRETFAYLRPLRDEKPFGIHTMVLIIFEQNAEMINKADFKVSQTNHDFVLKQWLEDNQELISTTPVAGSFYGYASADPHPEGTDLMPH
uniref:Secreted protein n=1 Tax=Panagrellus redivivus TaxID=6233 RepID=A0A7E4VT06_PANRE